MRIKVSEKEKFILRVAGIFLHENSVLLHRAEGDDIWALPGGGCEYFEDTQSALIREMQEELDADVQVGALAFSVENFFLWNGDKAHEIGFYYHANFTEKNLQFYKQDEFLGVEKHFEGFDSLRLYFKWFPLDQLDSKNVKPNFLKERLKSMQENPMHILNRDY